MRRSGTETRVSRGIAFLLFAVLVLSVLATLSLPGPAQPAGVPSPAAASGPNPPRGIHLSYLEDPTSAVFTWHTTSAASSRADWGTTLGGPYPFTATGTNYTSPGGSFLHKVTLTGLTPGLRYYYRVGDEAMASSYGEASFRAALPNGSTETFSFAASGDWSNSGNSATTSNGIGARDPNLVVPLGDLYYSANENTVKGVFEKFQAFGQGSFVQTVVGNHEYAVPGDNAYTPTEVHCAFINQPGNERTYSFKFGNTFFVALDWGRDPGNKSDGVDGTGAACGGSLGTNAIRSWLDAQLAAANLDHDITWKIVVQHFQCYDMTTQVYTLMCPDAPHTTIDQMEDIMNNRGVDLVLNGHEHSYARTHPVRFHTAIQTGSNYNTPGAPIYMTIGTAGASHTATCRTDTWVGRCLANNLTHGFGYFRVSPTSIQYEFVNNTAGVVDSFTLTKTPPTDYVISVEPSSGQMTQNAVTTASVSVLGTSTDAVSLSVSGCPPNTACTFSPASGSPNFVSTFRIETTSSSPNGNFDLAIAATNATHSKTVTHHLEISNRVSLTYQKGDGGAFSETDDTHIYNGLPNSNFGTETTLLVDARDCIAALTICKTLIKFPLIIGPSPGQIPSGSTIVNASLEMNIQNSGVEEGAYQVTEAWTESGASWNGFATHGFPGNRGLEFTFFPTQKGKLLIGITSIVQRWADGEANEGILLASAHTNGVDYDSSEASTNRPTLRVDFDLPPISPSFDFSVSVNPSSGTVSSGGSLSTTVTATLVLGSTHDVQYSCANLPAGASCTLTPTHCSPTCTTDLGIATSSGTPARTYAVSVQATDGTITRTSEFTLTVLGLVLHYDMETLTTDGWMEDLSGHGSNGTISGATDVGGKVGRARNFNGLDNVITTTGSDYLNGVTVAMWIRPNFQGADMSPFGQNANGYLNFWIPNGLRVVRWETNFGQAIVGTTSLQTNVWCHIAGTYDMATGISRLYVNGAEEKSAVRTFNPNKFGTLVVGEYGVGDPPNHYHWNGDIDEVYVFDRALTVAEIRELAPQLRGPLQYDMENLTADGRMKDLSGNGHHGTIIGTTEVPGIIGKARKFDGAHDEITTTGSDYLNGVTVAMWIRPNFQGGDMSPFGQNANGYLNFWIPNGLRVVRWETDGGQSLYGTTLLQTDGWYHIAGTYDVTTGVAKLYVNGAEEKSAVRTFSPNKFGTLVVGEYGGGLYNWNGDIDEVYVFDRALSAAEIRGLAPHPPSPLQYDMENITADGKMKDLSGNGHHGTIAGTTDVPGIVGRARSFDGVGDVITTTGSDYLNGVTVAMWIRPNFQGADMSPFGQNANGYLNFWIPNELRRLRWETDAVSSMYATTSLQSDVWYHIAATYDVATGIAKVYVNGLEENSGARTFNSTKFGTLLVGAYGLGQFHWNGDIDEVYVFGHALTGGEIGQLAGLPSSSVRQDRAGIVAPDRGVRTNILILQEVTSLGGVASSGPSALYMISLNSAVRFDRNFGSKDDPCSLTRLSKSGICNCS